MTKFFANGLTFRVTMLDRTGLTRDVEQVDFKVDDVWHALDAVVMMLRGAPHAVIQCEPPVKEILQRLGYQHPEWGKPEPKLCPTCGHEL